MSIGEQLQEPVTETQTRLRALVAPAVDVYEIRRLLLVGGCIATAGAANYGGSELPQRVPVAVGAAILGILLVLRRRPPARIEHVEADVDAAEAVAEPVDEPVSTRVPKGGRRASAQLLAFEASLGSVERQLEAHEQRLTSLSGRQSLLHVEARDKLEHFEARLEQLEARLHDAEELTQRIRAHHLDVLRLLQESLAEHRQDLAGLADGIAE